MQKTQNLSMVILYQYAEGVAAHAMHVYGFMTTEQGGQFERNKHRFQANLLPEVKSKKGDLCLDECLKNCVDLLHYISERSKTFIFDQSALGNVVDLYTLFNCRCYGIQSAK